MNDHNHQPSAAGGSGGSSSSPTAGLPIATPAATTNNTTTISLSVVIHRLVEQSYNNLMSLTERLPKESDIERKKQLVDYLDATREKFLKLLVLLKWSQHVSTLTKANEIIEMLNKEDNYFRDAADHLMMTKDAMINARAPIYDVPTAIDVLTTGSYQRMPTNIKRVLPPAPPLPAQIQSTIEKLNSILRYKLFTLDIPKEFDPIKVEDGKAHIKVENEYECFLSIDGGSDKSNWILLSFNLFIYSQKDREGEGPIKVAYDDKMKQVQDRIQARIVTSNQPLYELHNMLHYLVVSSQLSILCAQSENLKKTILKNSTRCIFGKDVKDQSITVFYWIPEELANTFDHKKPNIYIKIAIDPDTQKLIISHVPSLTHPNIPNYTFNVASLNLENILFSAIELHGYLRLQKLNVILYEERLKQQVKSFDDIKLIGSCGFENSSVVSSTDQKQMIDDESLAATLFIKLYGSNNHLDVSVNFQNGKYTLYHSTLKNRDLLLNLETRLNNDNMEIKSIVNFFRLKSLLSCIEEAAVFMEMECFYKIPIQNDILIQTLLESNGQYICIRFSNENEIFYLFVTIQNTSTTTNSSSVFTPSIFLFNNNNNNNSSQPTIFKMDSDEELTSLIQQQPSNTTEQNTKFQKQINNILYRLVESAKKKIKILQASLLLSKENIAHTIIPQPSSSSSLTESMQHETISFLYQPNNSVIQTNKMYLSFYGNDSDQSHQQYCTISFYDKSPLVFMNDQVDQSNTTQQQRHPASFVQNDHISHSLSGLWTFTYSTFSNNNWLNSFQNDIQSVNKMLSLSMQMIKQLNSTPKLSLIFHIDHIAPLELKLTCTNINTPNDLKHTIRIYVNQSKNYSIEYQPFVNPLVPFYERILNYNNTISTNTTITTITTTNNNNNTANTSPSNTTPTTSAPPTMATKINDQTPNSILNFLNSIAISNEMVYAVQSLIYPSTTTYFPPLETVIIPRNSTHIRLVYRNQHALDVRAVTTEHCIVEDAYFSTASLLSSQQSQTQKKLLSPIPSLHQVMEQRLGHPSMDNPLGQRTSWLVPLKTLKSTVHNILCFLNYHYLVKNFASLIKNHYKDAQYAPNQLKFVNENVSVIVQVREYIQVDMEATNTRPDSSPSKFELDTLSIFFKKNTQLSYRTQTIISLVNFFTLPIKVWIELCKIIRSGINEPEDNKPKYNMELLLNTSNLHPREALIHLKDRQILMLIVRFFSKQQEIYVDFPLLYDYQNATVRYWNKTMPTSINAEQQQQQQQPPTGESQNKKMMAINNLTDLVDFTNSLKSSQAPLYMFCQKLSYHIDHLFPTTTTTTTTSTTSIPVVTNPQSVTIPINNVSLPTQPTFNAPLTSVIT
ncbi:putative mediator complex subunit 14 [Cavenderia fasciculata]|uniref:Mediator of RNA polymerase II transcription subunit 14 n=1 Tax=Cavenderia fasciculata TaxID=261658 RepID=F4PYE6_CACFS|nr:putative mediator complex subunit 14 [Cavenderia fasciculata]EGG19413.1 putative mediator complex subunit 14 [Cavenderia fasciculata]|eukprot:XP_004357684.1 putative mediator complex subunit 14 [Cavenderia fasciculata]